MNLTELKNYKHLFKIIFILPLIIEKNILSIVNKNLTIHTEDTNKPQWENKIFLCYKNGGNFNSIKEKLEKNKYLYNKYTELTDDYYTIYAFNVPPEFKKDYNHLLKGEYTKLSHSAINKINGAWFFSDIISNYINDAFLGLHVRVKKHPALQDSLNLNQVPI